MAYDEELAARLRDLIGDDPVVSERKMFGGLAFLVSGHLAVAASGQGGLLVRTAPDTAEGLLAEPGVEAMEMKGRPMRGWLHVAPDRLASADDLATWVGRGVEFADSLPPKDGGGRS